MKVVHITQIAWEYGLTIQMNKHEQITSELLKIIPKDQAETIFKLFNYEIGPEFMGFIDIYRSLSEIIPKHFTVIDFGCSYAPQCFYFEDHKQYVGVDASGCYLPGIKTLDIRFEASNTVHYQMTIKEYIDKFRYNTDDVQIFAICSYVPPWYGGSVEHVLKAYRNVFTYYPNGGYPKL